MGDVPPALQTGKAAGDDAVGAEDGADVEGRDREQIDGAGGARVDAAGCQRNNEVYCDCDPA